jgi:hypothetical protein
VQLTEAQLEVLENALVANEAAVAAANGKATTAESVVTALKYLLMPCLQLRK